MKTYNLRVEDELMKKMKLYCVNNEVSIKRLIIDLIEQKLKEAEQEEK